MLLEYKLLLQLYKRIKYGLGMYIKKPASVLS